MLFSNLKKSQKNILTPEDFAEYRLANREIFIDNLTITLANTIDSQIRVWNLMDEFLASQSREPIKIYINCTNGSLDIITTIIDAIKISRTPVYTFNTGLVGSAALFVYLAGHKRYSYPTAIFNFTPEMLTPAWIEEVDENESSFYNKKDCFTKTYDELKRLVLEKTDIEEAQLNKHIKKDWWLTADDAFKARFCNEICRKHFKVEREDR